MVLSACRLPRSEAQDPKQIKVLSNQIYQLYSTHIEMKHSARCQCTKTSEFTILLLSSTLLVLLDLKIFNVMTILKTKFLQGSTESLLDFQLSRRALQLLHKLHIFKLKG